MARGTWSVLHGQRARSLVAPNSQSSLNATANRFAARSRHRHRGEDVFARPLANGDHRRVLDLALGGERVKALTQAFDAADSLQAVARAHLFRDDFRHGAHAEPGLRNHVGERGVVEFADDARTYVVGIEPLFETSTQHRLRAG